MSRSFKDNATETGGHGAERGTRSLVSGGGGKDLRREGGGSGRTTVGCMEPAPNNAATSAADWGAQLSQFVDSRLHERSLWIALYLKYSSNLTPARALSSSPRSGPASGTSISCPGCCWLYYCQYVLPCGTMIVKLRLTVDRKFEKKSKNCCQFVVPPMHNTDIYFILSETSCSVKYATRRTVDWPPWLLLLPICATTWHSRFTSPSIDHWFEKNFFSLVFF